MDFANFTKDYHPKMFLGSRSISAMVKLPKKFTKEN
jgi:hypothetical protein